MQNRLLNMLIPQARSQTLEAELAETSAQLQQLQVMQTALKTKNQLLEKLVQLNKQADMKSVPEMAHANAVRHALVHLTYCKMLVILSNMSLIMQQHHSSLTHQLEIILLQTVEDLYKQRGFKTVAEPILSSRLTAPALRLTIWETGEQYIPLEQIGKLSMQEFAKTYCVRLPLVCYSNQYITQSYCIRLPVVCHHLCAE